MMDLNHDHVFNQDRRLPGEFRTLIVLAVTLATMVLEIVAGVAFGSMALLADGLHMASHASALGISAFAYVYARRHASDERFCFGTGKVNSLAGFTGAIVLVLFALTMVWESAHRLVSPVEITFDLAIAVAVIGLLVNGASVWILGVGGSHAAERDDRDTTDDDPASQPTHEPPHEPTDRAEHAPSHAHGHPHAPAPALRQDRDLAKPAGLSPSPALDHAHQHDHNLRAAYLHVLADALTSVLAILALLAGKFWNLQWLDPMMGIVGAVLVARWSVGLVRSTSQVLLDHQGPAALRQAIVQRLADVPDVTVTDLHLWQIGPGIYSLILSLAARDPQPPDYYKRPLEDLAGLVHVTVEIWPRAADSPVARTGRAADVVARERPS